MDVEIIHNHSCIASYSKHSFSHLGLSDNVDIPHIPKSSGLSSLPLKNDHLDPFRGNPIDRHSVTYLLDPSIASCSPGTGDQVEE